jgi:hypothetical protein
VTGPLARPLALPRATVPGLSAPSPGGNLGNLFPKVTPAPAGPGAGPVGGGSGTGTALTAETVVTAHDRGGAVMLWVTIVAGLAAFVVWLTLAGPARRAVLSLTHRRGRR